MPRGRASVMSAPLLEVSPKNLEIKSATDNSDKPPPLPRLVRKNNLALNILATIALIAALYLARSFFIPLLIGILASYALGPLVDWLKACYVPRPLGAALILALLVAAFSWMAYSLRDDASAMVEKLPEAAHKLRQNMNATRSQGPSILQHVQEATNELQRAATEATGGKAANTTTVAKPPASVTWLQDYILTQSAQLVAGLAQAPIILLLIYFLLISGQHFRRKLVQLVGPSLSRKKEMVHLLEEINAQVQRYLLVILASNVLVGVGTWLAFEMLGMEQAGVWGVTAGILHFIPYLGPALLAFASAIAAFLQFDSPLQALAVGGVSLIVAGIIGMLLMTWLQSHFAQMNAAVLFIALLFFGWLWGAWGLLLSAPLVTIAKVVSDRVEPLKPVGELLGR